MNAETDPGYGGYARPDPAPEPGRVDTEAKIWFDFLAKKYWVSFSYHEGFIAFLKAAIPKRARRYDPGSRAWSFGRAYLGIVETEARKVFPEVQVELEPPRRSRPRAPRTEVPRDRRADLILEFFDALPAEAMKSAYKKGAMLLHPDRGGTNEAMQYLNELWERVKKELLSGNK